MGRVLQPPGGTAHRATSLDVDPAVGDGEQLLALEAVALEPDELAQFRRTFGPQPEQVRAALLEATADRGGLPRALMASVLVGTVAARGDPSVDAPPVGARVACSPPATAIPCWISSAAAWDGTARLVPVQGHAIIAACTPAAQVPDGTPAAVAAELVRVAHVPGAVARATGPAARVTVLGGATTAGAAAVLAAREAGSEVTALVTSLQEARLVDAFGGGRVVVGDLTGGQATRELVNELGVAPADVTFVAVPDPDVLVTAVLLTDDEGVVVCFEPSDATDALAVASASGRRQRVVMVSRGAAGREVLELSGRIPAFEELVSWRAGVGPLPAAGAPDDR